MERNGREGKRKKGMRREGKGRRKGEKVKLEEKPLRGILKYESLLSILLNGVNTDK